MATAGAGGARDARRRRIVDRGSDRLALITGKIQTLPSSSESSPPGRPYSPHSVTGLDPIHLSGEDKISDALLRKLESTSDAPQASSSSRYPLEDYDRTSTEASRSPNPEVRPKPAMPSALSPNGGSRSASPNSSGNLHRSNLPANLLKSINPGQISSAIAASTGTRLLCSAIGALLVVLSSIGFPILGSLVFRSILTFRPLYLVLLTNVTIVVAGLLSYKQQPGHKRADREENRTTPSNEEGGWVDHVGISLELGFLMLKVLDAVVMDCSFYAVVVVCGLSFFQMFF